MTTSDPTVALIQAVAQRDADNFAAKMADSSLEAAVDIWLRRIARRKVSPAVRTRLVRAVERGDAAETKDVQLTRAALLRKAGLDERPAAAAAIAAGATYTEVGRRARHDPTRCQRADPPLPRRPRRHQRSAVMNPDAGSVDRHVVIVTAAGSFTVAGERLTGPVDAVDKLERLDRLGAPTRRSAAPAHRRWRSGTGADVAGWGRVQHAGRLPGRGGSRGDRADRSGVGAAGHTRVGTAR